MSVRHSRTTASLEGNLLIATPIIQGSCFARSVIYMCSHDKSGAMGVIVNSPVENVHIKEIYEQLSLEASLAARAMTVHFGGPVDSGRGFVLHSSDTMLEGSAEHSEGIALSANISVLRELAKGQGPAKAMLMLGYSGWAAGQLESEIEQGSWIVVPATQTLVFDTENEMKWNLSAASLGVDMGRLSYTVGHA